MNDCRTDTESSKRSKIVRIAMGEYATWSPPVLGETIGPRNEELLADVEERRMELAGQLRRELDQYTDEEIEILSDRKLEDPENLRRAWDVKADSIWGRFSRKPPPWYAAGFGHPDHIADFEYWAKMPRFTVQEVLCLSVGIEPTEFEDSELDRLERRGIATLRTPLQFLLRRREQLKRQFRWGITPRDFLQWIEAVEFETHSEFVRLLKRYHLQSEDHGATDSTDAPTASNGRPDQREIDKIAQLFTAMACQYFGYDPKQKRSPATKEIADLAADMGMEVSDDTVRKYLRHGASFLPDDWDPHKI